MKERLPNLNNPISTPLSGSNENRNPEQNYNQTGKQKVPGRENQNFISEPNNSGETTGEVFRNPSPKRLRPSVSPASGATEVPLFPLTDGSRPSDPGFPPITRLPNEQARILVSVNSGIADDGFLRDLALAKVEALIPKQREGEQPAVTTGELVTRNRWQNLQAPEFAHFFQGVTRTNPRLRNIVLQAAMFGMDAIGVGKDPVDSNDSNPADITPAIFREIFQDEKLLASWMKNVDKRVKRSSQENIKDIDKKAKVGAVVKKDIVLVGGGPMTSHLASILGPFYDVTVITEQESIGKPWRDRPMYINSSVTVDGVDEPRLPLLGGTTTPISLSKQLNNLDTDVLLGGDALRVSCDDGTQRQYVSGMRLGDLVATEIVFNAKDYIVGQRVDTDIAINPDDTKRLTLTDKDGRRRLIDASAVIFLSGPGREAPKTADADSQFAYENSAESVRNQIAMERAARTKGQITLPKILTLTSIEQLMEYWQNDLQRDPKKWPFAPLFNPAIKVANVGGGDTSRVLEEFLKGRGPRRAYPDGFDSTGPKPRTTLLNVPQTTPASYDAVNRRRYGGGIKDASLVVPSKAKFISYSPTQYDPVSGPIGVQISYKEKDNSTVTDTGFAYAVVATGLERTPIEEEILGGLARVRDIEGVSVGFGDEDYDVYDGGSATGFVATDFPRDVQNIIEGLGISENTISLWAHGLLANRMGWHFLEKNGPNKEKVLALAA